LTGHYIIGFYYTKRKAVEFKERRDRRFLDLTKKR